jgi:hypothetical protein
MYQTWLDGITAGREPTGADLARAVGRAGDSTGTGRRAARRPVCDNRIGPQWTARDERDQYPQQRRRSSPTLMNSYV